MEKIPTAREFLEEKRNEAYHIPAMNYEVEAMIEFAKLHVQQALKEASENAETKLIKYTDDYEIDKYSILNSYSLDKIK